MVKIWVWFQILHNAIAVSPLMAKKKGPSGCQLGRVGRLGAGLLNAEAVLFCSVLGAVVGFFGEQNNGIAVRPHSWVWESCGWAQLCVHWFLPKRLLRDIQCKWEAKVESCDGNKADWGGGDACRSGLCFTLLFLSLYIYLSLHKRSRNRGYKPTIIMPHYGEVCKQ